MDETQLEHRLTIIEATGQATLAEMRRLTKQVAIQNGRVTKGEQWQQQHDLLVAHKDGVNEGKLSLRKRDYAIVMGMLTSAVGFTGIAAQLLGNLR